MAKVTWIRNCAHQHKKTFRRQFIWKCANHLRQYIIITYRNAVMMKSDIFLKLVGRFIFVWQQQVANMALVIKIDSKIGGVTLFIPEAMKSTSYWIVYFDGNHGWYVEEAINVLNKFSMVLYIRSQASFQCFRLLSSNTRDEEEYVYTSQKDMKTKHFYDFLLIKPGTIKSRSETG